MEQLFRRERGPDDVGVGDGRSVACMGEEITAKERAGGFLEQNARLPVVRDVRRIDMPDALAAEIDDRAVGQLARRSIAQVRIASVME